MNTSNRVVSTLAGVVALMGIGLAYPVPADAGTAGTSKQRAEQPQRDYTLDLGGISFDPVMDPVALPMGWDRSAEDGPDLRLVQFDGPTQAGWLEQLEAAGLDVVQYIYPHAYITWAAPAALEGARNIPAARWAGDFAPGFRVQPQWRNLPDAEISTKVLMFRGTDTDAVIRGIHDLGGRNTGRRVLNRTFEVAGFMVSGARFQDIAQIPGVYSVQPVPTDGGLRGEMSNQVCADNVFENNQAFPGYQSWLDGLGLDGTGVVLANVDGGVQDNHPDLLGQLLPCDGVSCGGGATSGHGTHTAGIMAATGASGTLDAFGFLRGQGVAPGAKLVEQKYSPFFQDPGGMLLLMYESYANGAILSGNSWGPSGSPLGYDDDTLQCDIGARDTDPDTPGDQPLLYVLSIMNGNGGTSSQGTPDEAKNIFTIGSTKMQTSGGAQILDIDDLSSNSAHGPCLDGRKIPHLVAPGCQVDSSYSGSGYNLLCGTSMASPHVSGAVALFVEHYRNRPEYTDDPSPALIKAAFLPVAHDLAGNLDADGGLLSHPFDNKQGWGRMNVPPVINPPDASVRYFDQETIFDNTGEEWVVNVSPLDPSKPVRIMLVWTDAPGHGLGGSTPAWNNDLDLIVESGASTYLGNNFGPDGYSVTGGSADFRNNTEGVYLGPVPPGNLNIRIVAADINSDGLPNSGDGTDQDFALVCYNCAEEPGFTMAATPAAQDVCAPADAVYTVDVGQILGYEEPVTLGATGHPAGTSVSFADNPVVPPATTTMTVSGTGSATPGDYTVLITGNSVDLSRSTSVGLGLFSGVPALPILIAPANGATDVSVAPTLEWSGAPQSSIYHVEIATDPGFGSIVYTADTDEMTHTVADPLDTDALHYWRVAASNECGDGPYSSVFSFTTQDVPSVLLVDDDDNSPNVRSYYTDALDALGIWYDIWDTNNSDDEPSAVELAPYRIVIWFTGDEFGGSCGPGGAGESALSSWLDNGGCLFISSQDYLYDRGQTGFMTNYLGMSSGDSDVTQTSVTGQGSVFGGMGTFGLSFPFSNWSDIISPSGSGELAFSGNQGDAAIDKDGGVYRTTFWGFPLEAISSAGDREDLLQTVLDWCGGLVADCPEDVNGDNAVDILDLLAVLAAWGGGGGPEDVNDDGTVDVLDLLAVLSAWGPCE